MTHLSKNESLKIAFQLIFPGLMHIDSHSSHWLVQWHSIEWGLPSMTTAIFSFSPICHLLRSCEWQKQHGSMWCSMAELGLALGGRICFGVGGMFVYVCAHAYLHQCGGKLPFITYASMCQETGKFHIPHTHTTCVTQEIKNLMFNTSYRK